MYDNGDGVELDEKKCVELLKEAADLGYLDAIYILAEQYSRGYQVEKNIEKAHELYKKGAELGHADSQYEYYLITGDERWLEKSVANGCDRAKYKYSEILFSKRRYHTAIIHLRDLAIDGDKDAQYLLAKCYEANREYEDRIKWLERAAESNHVLACYEIAEIYNNSYNFRSNKEKAIIYYKKAASLDNELALFKVGCHLEKTEGKEKSWSFLSYFQRILEIENKVYGRQAASKLAYYYYNGIGIEKNYDKAFEYLLAAVENIDKNQHLNSSDEIENSFLLAECYYNGYGTKVDYNEAFKYYSKACISRDPRALTQIGDCYYEGHGTTKNLSESFYYFEQAALQDYGLAQYFLGCSYYFGDGVKKNLKKAFY